MINLTQNPVFTHTLHTMTDPNFHIPGPLGEVIVAHLLQHKGYRVRVANHQAHGYHLKVVRGDEAPLKIAIYTAQIAQNIRGRNIWKFHVRHSPAEKTYFDVAILLCLLEPGKVVPFVVPSSEFESMSHIAITTDPWTYKGRFARYRQSLYQLNLEMQR